MYRSNIPPWLNIATLGSAMSISAGIFGFYDYFVPTTFQGSMIDLEENLSDLYIAGLALVGGLFGLYGNLNRTPDS